MHFFYVPADMTKKDLINQIYMQLGFSKLVTENLINDFLSPVILNLKDEKNLSLGLQMILSSFLHNQAPHQLNDDGITI